MNPPFSKKFLVFFAKICYFECNITSDWLNRMFYPIRSCVTFKCAEQNSSVGSVADLRTGGCWFDPRLGQYSFRGLMIVVATRFIPLSP